MLSKLNPPQREAVKYLDGPLLVLAGAGSGKTRVITQKIAHLVQQSGYKPEQIAAILDLFGLPTQRSTLQAFLQTTPHLQVAS